MDHGVFKTNAIPRVENRTTVTPDDRNYGLNALLEQVISSTSMIREKSLLLVVFLCKSLQIRTRRDDRSKKMYPCSRRIKYFSIKRLDNDRISIKCAVV